ncbi:ABC transporter substrate-binding protein [Roseomonas sp. AR75]|uniref:ABC transporter substrate-binding protein n=1 Tax=Roseomonas sp. AR75 TaxID=2562311 RepID=UPI0010C1415E|nr:ABC transporter substrate-binding protein [Roseomonas sp. AR75]
MSINATRLARRSALGLLALPLLARGAAAQGRNLRQIVFVQPSPSAINSYPIFVGMGEGYFQAEGLTVRSEAVNGSGPVLQALSSGQAQFGRPGPGPVLRARARGVDVVFLYNSLPRSSFGILVKTGSSYRTPDQLRGKVIGVGTADGAEVGFARAILSDLGMQEPRDYRFIPVGDGGPAVAGFMRGDIEAYVGSTADAAILNFRGMAVRDITPDRYQTFFGNGYVAMGPFINANPQVVEGFGRALVRATRFTNDPANRDKVLRHLAVGNPQEIENRNFANALLDQVLEKGKPHDPSKGWGWQDPAHWAAWHQSLVDSKELAAPLPNLEAAYTNRFIEAWNRT